MISLRLALPAVLVAAALAGCFTYFVSPSPRVEAEKPLPPTMSDLTSPAPVGPTNIDQGPSTEAQAAAAYQRAAEAILKRAPDARASTSTDEGPITGHIPLPRRRPIPR